MEDTFWESEQKTFPGAKNPCEGVLDNAGGMIGWVITVGGLVCQAGDQGSYPMLKWTPREFGGGGEVTIQFTF